MLIVKVDQRDYNSILSMSGTAFETGKQTYFVCAMRDLLLRWGDGLPVSATHRSS